jgi:MYXO-CTERM domain-containing protein
VDLGSAWLNLSFDDSAWLAGPGQLGYGDGDEATVLYDPTPKYPTVYFRKVIPLNGPVTAADLRVIHDDGVAVWVNGTQVFGEYVDNGTAYSAFASAMSGENELSTATLSLAPNPFVAGDNVIAAVVKQAGDTSSDVSFDLELTLTVAPQTGTGGAGGAGGGQGTGGAGTGGMGGASTGGGMGGASTGSSMASSTGMGSSTASGTGTGGAGGDGTGNGGTEGGCGCHTSGPPGSSLGVLGLAVVGLLRRRRR